MPRCARIKSHDAIYHVMARSISEVDLFKTNDDKKKYLSIVKEYQKEYLFRVYAYCLMNNHVHLLIDCNGADISQIMHDINFKYAQYFNGIHKRHGHLFQDRFKSKMVKDDRYIYTLSAYIHNNPMDIKGYEKKPQNYYFSSLGIYLGLRKDPFELVEDSFVLGMFGNTQIKARANYYRFVLRCNDLAVFNDIEFEEEGTEYKSKRKILVRDFKEEDVVNYITENMEISKIRLHMKYCKELVEAKAILSVILRSLCNVKCSDICKLLGNVTQARVSSLCRIGIELISSEEKYKNVIEDFIMCHA